MSQVCACPRMFSYDLVWTNSKGLEFIYTNCRIQCTDAELQFKAEARSLRVICQSSLMSCSAFSAFTCVAADTGLPNHGLSQLLVSPDLKCFSHLYTFLSFMASTLYSLQILMGLFTAWTLTLYNFFPYTFLSCIWCIHLCPLQCSVHWHSNHCFRDPRELRRYACRVLQILISEHIEEIFCLTLMLKGLWHSNLNGSVGS